MTAHTSFTNPAQKWEGNATTIVTFKTEGNDICNMPLLDYVDYQDELHFGDIERARQIAKQYSVTQNCKIG